MRVIIDTREQKPLMFDKSIKQTLLVGDYTTAKHLNKLHIERKSPGDLYGTLLAGHVRFRKEVKRAIANDIILIVIVECSASDFYDKKWPGAKYCKVPSKTLNNIIRSMTIKYKLKFIWCKDRDAMTKRIIKLLK